jgi:hypothetical protein
MESKRMDSLVMRRPLGAFEVLMYQIQQATVDLSRRSLLCFEPATDVDLLGKIQQLLRRDSSLDVCPDLALAIRNKSLGKWSIDLTPAVIAFFATVLFEGNSSEESNEIFSLLHEETYALMELFSLLWLECSNFLAEMEKEVFFTCPNEYGLQHYAGPERILSFYKSYVDSGLCARRQAFRFTKELRIRAIVLKAIGSFTKGSYEESVALMISGGDQKRAFTQLVITNIEEEGMNRKDFNLFLQSNRHSFPLLLISALRR